MKVVIPTAPPKPRSRVGSSTSTAAPERCESLEELIGITTRGNPNGFEPASLTGYQSGFDANFHIQIDWTLLVFGRNRARTEMDDAKILTRFEHAGDAGITGFGRTHHGQRRGLMPARPFRSGFTDAMMHSAQPGSRRKFGLARLVEIPIPRVGPRLPAMAKKAV